jgi:hypothetical protein
MESNDIKLKIAAIVTQYERDNAPEYTAFLMGRKAKTDNLINKFGETKSSDFIERILFEMPETLDGLLVTQLEDDEMQFLRSKIGGLWFAKTFKQYNVSQHT